MAIDALCPHCRKLLRAPDKKAGQQVNCPHCQQPIIVPEKLATASLERPGSVGPLQAVQQQPVSSPKRQQVERATAAVDDHATETQPSNGSPLTSTDTVKSNGAPSSAQATVAARPEKMLPRAAPVSRTADATWYMRTPDDQQYGPVKRQELDQWVGEGRIDSECQILCEGWEQWKWASDVYPQLSSLAAEPMEIPSIVAETTVASFPQFENQPFNSVSSASATSGVSTSGAATSPSRDMPPPLPSSGPSTAAPTETVSLAGIGSSANVQRAWIVTDAGLAIANVSLWLILGGVASLFVLYWLSQTVTSARSVGMIGSLFLWTAYACVAAVVELVTSWCVCQSTPRQAGARGWIQGALGVVGLGLAVAVLVSGMADLWHTEAPRFMARHLPAVSVILGLAGLAFFALFLGKLGNFFGDGRLIQQGAFCAGFQAVILAWSLVAMYALTSGTDATANIMRAAVTAALVGGDAVWLGILTRRARLPLKSI